MTLRELVSRWQNLAQVARTHGATGQAVALELCITDLTTELLERRGEGPPLLTDTDVPGE